MILKNNLYSLLHFQSTSFSYDSSSSGGGDGGKSYSHLKWTQEGRREGEMSV